MNIEITEDEFNILLVTLGMALAISLEQNNKLLARAILTTTNAVGKNKPNWKPYDIPKSWE